MDIIKYVIYTTRRGAPVWAPEKVSHMANDIIKHIRKTICNVYSIHMRADAQLPLRHINIKIMFNTPVWAPEINKEE